MKAIKYFLLPALVALFAFSVGNVTDNTSVVRTYTDAWLATDNEDRLEMIGSFWTHESTYHDPEGKETGIDSLNNRIENFREKYPLAEIRYSTVSTTSSYCLWTWEVVTPDEQFLLRIRNVAEVDEEGKIKRVMSFIQEEK